MRRQAEPALKDKSVSDSDTKKPAPEIPGMGNKKSSPRGERRIDYPL